MKRVVKRTNGQALAATTTAEVIADALRQDIAHGSLQSGQALRQDELATRFGVSRIPVREALRRLEEGGLVTVHANRGAFVTTLTDADVTEVFELRILLEADLVKRAARAMTPTDVDAAERIMLEAERGAHSAEWSRLDSAFHCALYEPAKRPRQLTMIMALRGLVQRSGANAALPAQTEQWLNHHRTLLTACRAGDHGRAGQVVEDHLRSALQVVRDRLAARAAQEATGLPYYDEVRWRKAMLDLRPNCECCDRDLPNGDPAARICTFECTFCARCVNTLFGSICPNCGGDFVERPTRPTALLGKAPPSSQRVNKHHPERERLGVEQVPAQSLRP